MLKEYILIGLHSDFQNPKEMLARAIPLYDKRAEQIRSYFQERLDGHDDAKAKLDKALSVWKESKKLLEQEPTKENALLIQKNFSVMNKNLREGIHPLSTPELDLITLTGKLCVKPFVITIDYLMKIWGGEVKDYDAKINKIIVGFGKNLALLSQNKLNNDKSRQLLQKAKNYFQYFEFAHQNGKLSIPSLLSRRADDNFKLIRQIKSEFKKQAAKAENRQ